jgi:hypothetical protein
MAGNQSKPMQMSFLIGPPVGPEEMRALYVQAELSAKGGDDGLTKKLFDLRKEYLTSVASSSPAGKSMLHRIFEELLGKEIAMLDASVAHSFLRGEMVPSLTIALQSSAYADGTPIGADASEPLMKAVEASLRLVLKAKWIQSTII